MANKIERAFERGLFAARWLIAPMYVGLIFCLIMLLYILVKYVILVAMRLPEMTVHEAVVATLSFIDLTLIVNLVLIVLYTGFENFVSKMDLGDHDDRPAWLGQFDFTGLKLKLFATIVAITGIELLKAFMDLRETGHVNPQALTWLAMIHGLFLLTTLVSALSQWLEMRAHGPAGT